jgi:hypothetical protein
MRTTVTTAAAGLALALAGPALAEPPNIAGQWKLDRKRSDDAVALIEQVAGSGQVKGGGASGLTILPEGGTRSEVERVELRTWMLGIARQLDALEVSQTPEEVRLALGDTVRIFYFGREHVRQDSEGRKLKCRVRWQGQQLVTEEDGEKGMRLRETFTLEPANDWLVQAVYFESPLLKKPLELRLLYTRDRAKP